MVPTLLALTLVAWFVAPSGVKGEQLVDPGYRRRKVYAHMFVEQLGSQPVQLDRRPRGRLGGPQGRHGVSRVRRHHRDGMR